MVLCYDAVNISSAIQVGGQQLARLTSNLIWSKGKSFSFEFSLYYIFAVLLKLITEAQNEQIILCPKVMLFSVKRQGNIVSSPALCERLGLYFETINLSTIAKKKSWESSFLAYLSYFIFPRP